MKTRRTANLFGDYLYMLVNKNIRTMAGKFYTILDQDDINDLVHDAYLKVVGKKHLYRVGGNFEGWVFRICQNFIREVTPKQSKRLLEMTSYDADGADDSITNDCDYLSYMADCTYTPDKEICERESMERIDGALGRLNGEKAQLAGMMLDGFSTDEMEEQLDCSNGTLRAKVCRLRKELRSYGICG